MALTLAAFRPPTFSKSRGSEQQCLFKLGAIPPYWLFLSPAPCSLLPAYKVFN